jgi:RecQ family ATP-dependent DNA helicase
VSARTRAAELERLLWLEGELREAVPRFKQFTCEEQARIALAFHDGQPRDVLGILPTGTGKSLCYLLPTYLWKKEQGRALTVVVSPLLALMQDQVDKVEFQNDQVGGFRLHAEQLNSSISTEERRRVRRAIRNHQVNLLFLGPEALVNPWNYEMLLDAARNGTLRGLVIDEAHMINTWGNEFRPDFWRMGPIRKLLQDACPADAPLRTLVLTATLPREQRADVLDAMGIEEESFETIELERIRQEHHLSVQQHDNHKEKLRQLVKDVRRLRESGPGIIYCAMRDHCEEIGALLTKKDLGPAYFFHGRTPADERRDILRQFRKSRRMIVVATDAFGLGVDKRDVRWVLHFSMPDSLDQYYQEIGRAGRDGKECEAILYYSPTDKGLAKKNSLRSLTTEKFDSRLRTMFKNSMVLKRKGEKLRLIDQKTIPDYVDADKDTAPKLSSLRLHMTWNYAVLVRAHQLGWIRISPDVMFEASCLLSPRSSIEAARRVAPGLARAGALRGLSKTRPIRLKFGEVARERKLDIESLQREFYDLMLDGVVTLPAGQDPWDTRILVEDLIDGHTGRLRDDRELRLDRQRDGSRQVELMARYAKAKRCRRLHFYEAYEYQPEASARACGNCDVCDSPRARAAAG